ncbi:MAG: helix-turn-helix domain-containing protein [Candidatus Undinarchaeales archaeon]|nr:helix-turn-helix domain-containing protein [Candidatus Undinarchaeales archaeon]
MDVLISKVGFRHKCWVVDLSEKYPELDIETKPFFTDAVKKYVLTDNTWKGTTAELNAAFEYVKSHDLVKDLKVLYKSNNVMRVLAKTKYDKTATQSITDSGCLFFDSVHDSDGMETATIMSENKDSMMQFYNTMNEIGEAKLLKLKKTDIGTPKPTDLLCLISSKDANMLPGELSAKQLEIFNMAYKLGYYTYPRKVSIRDMAELADLHENTVREHIRKAETKLVPLLYEVVQKFNPGSASVQKP